MRAGGAAGAGPVTKRACGFQWTGVIYSAEMGGYFVCNGIERIIRCLIQQRRHYVMALKRGAYLKRGANYTEFATLVSAATDPS